MSKVILIVIDGLRPDAIEQAETPAIDALIAGGSVTLTARTVTPSITLPAHFSLFTSLHPRDHNVTTNTASPRVSSAAFGIMEAAKYNGLSTAAVYSWELLRNLAPPDSLDATVYLNVEKIAFTDSDIMEAGIRLITDLRPDVCFIYLEGTDLAGHRWGWMSDSFLSEVQLADQAIGLMMKALHETHLDREYAIILQADHGGEGHHHFDPVDTVMTIPWIAFGEGVRQGHRIESPVSILDTAPTTAKLLGIRPHYGWKGRVVEEIFTTSAAQASIRSDTNRLEKVGDGMA